MTRQDSIKLRHKRLRKKVSGTAERPRLAVNFSGRHIRAQVIDDTKGVTLAAASTQEKGTKSGANVANATSVGKLVADRAKGKSISKVVFDRGGFQYMGKVKALADAAREAGLEF
jgi:large subunit ribosomal protein L18